MSNTQTALPIASYLRQLQEGSRITVGAWEDEAEFVRYARRSFINPAIGNGRPEAYVWVDGDGSINIPFGGLPVLTIEEAQRLSDLLTLASITAKRVRAAKGFVGVAMAVAAPIHRQTGSSTVRCGVPMRDEAHPDGWDLGNSTVSPRAVTCPDCLAHHVRPRPVEGRA